MKDTIKSLLLTTNRSGMNDLVEWLENETDFFTAPASTRFHGSHEGGLAEHSYNVYQCISSIQGSKEFRAISKKFDDDSIIIVSLLHDLCKTNFYKVSMRNKKDERGTWIQVPFYEVEDAHPYGHGECSVMLAEKFIDLTDEERYAIRWHMGAYDKSETGGYAMSAAFDKYPLAVALHMADIMASYIVDKKAGSK